MDSGTLGDLLLEAISIALEALGNAFAIVRPYLYEGAQSLADLLAP
jgi:hypothetical protein